MVARAKRSRLAGFYRRWRLAFRIGRSLNQSSPDIFKIYPGLIGRSDVERVAGGWVYRGGFYPDYLHMGGASHSIARVAREHCVGRGADIGAGLWPLEGAVPIDAWRGPGVRNSPEDFEQGEFDYVFSSHCLEHIDDWPETLTQWTGLVRPGGVLFLYLPHPECEIWKPASAFVGDGHVWAPSPPVVKKALEERGFDIQDFDDGPDHYMSFYVCGQKRATPKA